MVIQTRFANTRLMVGHASPCVSMSQDGFRCGRGAWQRINEQIQRIFKYNCQWAGSFFEVYQGVRMSSRKNMWVIMCFHFCWCLAMFNPIDYCPTLSRWVEATHWPIMGGAATCWRQQSGTCGLFMFLPKNYMGNELFVTCIAGMSRMILALRNSC